MCSCLKVITHLSPCYWHEEYGPSDVTILNNKTLQVLHRHKKPNKQMPATRIPWSPPWVVNYSHYHITFLESISETIRDVKFTENFAGDK